VGKEKTMNVEHTKKYLLKIESENDLAYEIVKIVNLSMEKGCQITNEKRSLTNKEEDEQISHMISLLTAIMEYIDMFDFQDEEMFDFQDGERFDFQDRKIP
jgi:hypothetical protein